MQIKDVIDIVDATSATLSGSSFDNVNLSGTVFNNVNLAGTRFNDINFSGASFTDSNMSGWSIDDVNFTGLKLSNTNLSGADNRLPNDRHEDRRHSSRGSAGCLQGGTGAGLIFTPPA